MRLLILLGAFCVAPTLFADTPAPPLPKTFDVAKIDAFVAGQVKEKGYVGLSLCVFRDGKVVLAKGYGLRSLDPKEPMDENTSLRIGSVSKQFTCAAILLLAEDGKLSVNDKVAKWFPELTKANEITLLDMMNHVSGYPDYYPLDFVDSRMKKDISLEQLAKDYAGGKLDFEPGSKYSYSNTGYILLGGIVEKVSGESLGAFLKKRIFDPLDMTQTRYLDAGDLKNRATGYWSCLLGPPEKALDEPHGWIAGAGGLWCSAPDLAKWDIALVSGKVLKPESYKLMTGPRELTTHRISNYGCGVNLSVAQGDRALGHGGAVFGFLAHNAVFPRSKSGVVLLANTEHVRSGGLFTQLMNLVAADQAEKTASNVPKVDGPEPKKVVLDFFHDLQEGKIDRSKLGEEFSLYMTDERVKAAAPRLKAMGEPDKVSVGDAHERGGMASLVVTMTFKDKVVKASLYRTPDGKIQQLLFNNE